MFGTVAQEKVQVQVQVQVKEQVLEELVVEQELVLMELEMVRMVPFVGMKIVLIVEGRLLT